MEWNDKDLEALRSFTSYIDCDDITVKEKIKKTLLNNRFIIHVLNNKELDAKDCEPDNYYGVNILPYYMISPTQTNIQNFICFEVNYDMQQSYQYSKSHKSLNNTVKTLQIVFYILCEQKNVNDEETGIARHDLLAALIQDQFNWTNIFGSQIMLVSDVASIVDSKYACRTLTFEQTTDNNVVKTKDNIPRFVNKISYE